ncbi:VWA domain-containing protein [Compostibacter hankyongensis]|uniref:VWA domain-containing protein n=1 Tax=Compostibacter hankyongensis TaxID=1007089 RepID=A0ABP8G538_9BACT
MVRFQHSFYLYGLLLLIVLLLVFVVAGYRRRRSLRMLGDLSLVQQLLGGYSRRRYVLKFAFLFLAFLFLVVGAANLQIGNRMEKITRKGVDVMIALDVSKSMLAQDIQPSRLDRAKQLISRLLDKMSNDRVGLVVFAGNAYLQMPLTVDYSAAKMYLGSVTPDMIPTQGTALDKAISLCQESFNQKERKHKAIILISDGEDWDNNANTTAKKAYEDGVVINTVGIGSAQGAPIRDPETGAYKKDAQGNVVVTKLNETELRAIAAAARGVYARLDNTDQVADVLAGKLSSMEKKTYGENLYTDYASYFQYFLGIGLVLLLLEFFIPDGIRKTAWG